MSAEKSFFDNIQGELWFAHRLKQLGRGVFTGDTTPEIRKQRIREAIIEGDLDVVIIGRRNGKPETFEDCFARLYGEPLFTTKAARKAG